METTIETSARGTTKKEKRDASVHAAPELTLENLAARSYRELEALYRGAPNAKSMYAVHGAPKGRMLAVRFLDLSPLRNVVRSYAASSSFLWDGKTFNAASDDEGDGINRVYVPGVFGRQNLFPFKTFFDPSAIDGKPALILNYDLAENPPYIRKIHDEVREVAPGLFLGPAMWKAALGPKTVLWFALDNR
jgi:hypothetical protein